MAKSEKHIILQRRALTWLDAISTERGIRGCEEVIIKKGYVADAAAICGLQNRFEKKFAERNRLDSPNFISDDYTFIFETKVSRSDYLSTFANEGSSRSEKLANFHFIVAAKGILHETEIPKMWGLLTESGQGLRMVRQAPFIPHSISRLHEFAYIILISGHNRKFTYCKELIPNQHLF